MKTKKENISQLLNQIIGLSIRKDEIEREKNPELVGESSVTFHLKVLKSLIESNDD